MYSIFGRESFVPGTHLRVTRPDGAWVHHGIYVGGGWVIHAEKDRAVVYATLEEFAAGGVPEVVERPSTWEQGAKIVARAEAAIGTPYDALSANCEHLATFAKRGEATSSTVRGAVVFGVVAWLLSRD